MKQKQTTLLFAWIIGLTLLAFTTFNAVNYYLLSSDYHEQIITENRIYTENVALGVSAFFENSFRVVGEMAYTLEFSNMNAAEQQEFIASKFSEYGFFDNIIIQRVPDGVQTARIKGDAIALPEQGWFRKAMEEKRPFITPSFYSFGFEQSMPVISNSICFPLVKEDRIVGVLAAFLRTDELQGRVGRYYRGDDRYTYILDEEGKVIVYPGGENNREIVNYKTGKKEMLHKDEQGKPVIADQEFQLTYQDIDIPGGLQQGVQQALNGFTGVTEYLDAQGTTIICSYAPIQMPGYSASWVAVTVQSKDKAMAALRESALANGLLSFCIFACLAMLLLRQSRAVELGARRLAENNAALEAEVIERTRVESELTATNEELTAMNEELTVVSEQLQFANEQMTREMGVRQSVEEKLRRRDRQYREIVKLLADANEQLDTKMQIILDSILQLASAEDGCIVVVENEAPMVRYVRGRHSVLLGQELARDQGLLPEVLETRRLLYVRDYQAAAKHKQGEFWQDIRSIVLVPLRDKKHATGCLVITWAGCLQQMTDDELELLQQYADLASLALQEAGYREKLRLELVQRNLLHEQISHMAFHDALTGLPNRASLMSRLETELAQPENSCSAGVLFFIDLDDLKSINDNFGHSAGDQVIIGVGQQIREALGPHMFIARLGGDEFIALLPTCWEKADIEVMADKLIQHLCRDYFVNDISLRLSTSMGIVRYPDDGITVEELLKKADMAMYAAKAAGRNCWRFFESSLLADAQEKLLLTNSLRGALQNRELSLVYQPQVEIASNTVIGFEVLLRWHSPEHGFVSPARFIPLAEESRLIFPIGEWILKQACDFIQKLSQLGYEQLRVAVNLSTKQLSDNNLVQAVAKLLADSGINPARLELEITESALLTSLEDGVSKLQQLEQLGVRISLDDFGTGYSSLTHLRLFPVETLKIDKSFIDAIPGKEAVLVKSLVKFAQELKMTVVAEGVETQEQFDYLADCGCNVIQGYFMSRPVPEQEALAYLQAVNSRENTRRAEHE